MCCTIESKGIDSLTIQFGRGEYVPKKIAEVGKSANITVEVMRYTRDNKHFQDLLHKSVLVISHAGAGCILETLHKKKPLFVVVNERLMNNHQVEIAKPLAKAQYLYYSNVSKFISTLDKCDITKLKPYPQPNYFAFSNLVNQEMGI